MSYLSLTNQLVDSASSVSADGVSAVLAVIRNDVDNDKYLVMGMVYAAHHLACFVGDNELKCFMKGIQARDHYPKALSIVKSAAMDSPISLQSHVEHLLKLVDDPMDAARVFCRAIVSTETTEESAMIVNSVKMVLENMKQG